MPLRITGFDIEGGRLSASNLRSPVDLQQGAELESPVCIGVNYVLITNLEVICKGKVGEMGARFCCNNVACEMVVHRNRKEIVKVGLYTKEKGLCVAFLEP